MYWRQDIDPEGGAFKVLLRKGEWTDHGRQDRRVPYKIYYPQMEDPQKCPVILWSHGFGGNRDGAGFLSRFLASYGYCVVHMTHDGTDSSLWERQKGRHPWDVLRSISVSREVTVERFLDVPFVLDRLQEWEAQDESIGRYMDLAALGMSGHSFGALTTQVMAGQLFPDDNLMLASYREPRFRAAIAYSPVPTRRLVGETLEPRIYEPVSLPFFCMTGTQDESPLEGFDYERRLVVYEYAGSSEKYLLIKKGGDHMVYNGTRGKLEANPLRAGHERIIKISSLAFWDAYMKGQKNALEWLRGAGLSSCISAGDEYRFI